MRRHHNHVKQAPPDAQGKNSNQTRYGKATDDLIPAPVTLFAAAQHAAS